MAEQLEALQQTIAERDSELLALNQELSDLADRLPVRPSAATSQTLIPLRDPFRIRLSGSWKSATLGPCCKHSLASLLCVSAAGTAGRHRKVH